MKHFTACDFNGSTLELRYFFYEHRKRFKNQKSASFYSASIINGVLPKLTLGILCALSLSACQPNDSNSDDTTNEEQATESNEKSQALVPERLQTIEKLAGVSMQQLVKFDPQEVKQGGDTGISISSAESYSKPSSNLTASRKGSFFIGNAFFKQPWVIAPASTDSRDGLGALFNVAACQSCHIKDGRGHAPMNADDDADSLLIRLAMPATTDEQRQQLNNSLIEKSCTLCMVVSFKTVVFKVCLLRQKFQYSGQTNQLLLLMAMSKRCVILLLT